MDIGQTMLDTAVSIHGHWSSLLISTKPLGNPIINSQDIEVFESSQTMKEDKNAEKKSLHSRRERERVHTETIMGHFEGWTASNDEMLSIMNNW